MSGPHDTFKDLIRNRLASRLNFYGHEQYTIEQIEALLDEIPDAMFPHSTSHTPPKSPLDDPDDRRTRWTDHGIEGA